MTLKSVLFFILLFVGVLACGQPQFLNLQSRIVKPNGIPLEESSVQFRFTTTDPIGTCVLYVEDFSNVDMSGSKGLVNFKLGSGARSFPGVALQSTELFNNFGSPVLNCQGGGTYTASSSDSRKLIVQFNDGTGWQTVPSMEINSVPFALQANSAQNLGSYPASSYLRTAALPTCGGSQALHFDGTTITCVGTGGSSYSSLSGASSTNTIDNTNYAQTWNWSTATTQNPITMTANSLTTGSLLNLTTSNNSLNSSNGLLNIANTGTSTTGTVARIQSNSTAGSGLTVLANGNVGIGISSPSSTLQVNQASGAGIMPNVLTIVGGNSSSTSGGGVSITGGNGGTGGVLSFTAGTANGGCCGATSGSSISLGAGTGGGTVGALQINGGESGNGAAGGAVNINGGTGSGTGGAVNITAGSAGNGQNGGSVTLNPGARQGAGTDGNIILANLRGNVGIGTSNPGAQLEVTTGATTTKGLIINGQAAQTANLTEWSVPGAGMVGGMTAAGIFYALTRVESQNLYSTDGGGYNAIQINGTNRSMAMTPSGSSAPDVRLYRSGSNTLTLDNNAAGAGNLNVMGSVGIGTISPSGTLDVQGGTAPASTNGVPVQIFSQSGGTGNTNGGNIELRQGSGSGLGGPGSIFLGSKTAYDGTGFGYGHANIVNSSASKTALNILSTGPYLSFFDFGGNVRGQINNDGSMWFNKLSGTWSASGNLTLDSTTNGTKGFVLINPSGGNVGIGTSGPGYKLDVQGGDINASGSVRAAGVALTSDVRYKKDIEPIRFALEKIMNLQGVTYNWRRDEFPKNQFSERHQMGVIAQDVEIQFPELVDTNKEGYKSVNYPALVAPLIESIKSLFKNLVGIQNRQDQQMRELELLKSELQLKSQRIRLLEVENAAIKKWICKTDPSADVCQMFRNVLDFEHE